jgi:flagellar motor switch protein FliM
VSTATARKAPVRYDFRRPNKFNREHVRALHLANETFARQFTTVLSSTLRAVSQVTLRGVGQTTYDEYVQTIPNPTYLAMVALRPLDGAAVLHLPLHVVMAAVDRMLGGQGTAVQPRRPVTEIEAAVLRNLLARVLRELAYAWDSLAQLTPEVVYQESNPQFAQIAAPSDMVVVISFDIRIGSATGMTTLCIPFASLQPVLDELTANVLIANRQLADPVAIRLDIEQRLESTPLQVSVAFEEVTLTSSEIVNLQPGDLLPLHHPINEPLSVTVGGVPCFPGKAGRRGSRLACVLVEQETGAKR